MLVARAFTTERWKLGMQMPARIPRIRTTVKSSTRVKPAQPFKPLLLGNI